MILLLLTLILGVPLLSGFLWLLEFLLEFPSFPGGADSAQLASCFYWFLLYLGSSAKRPWGWQILYSPCPLSEGILLKIIIVILLLGWDHGEMSSRQSQHCHSSSWTSLGGHISV